jgi:hypothetical protein
MSGSESLISMRMFVLVLKIRIKAVTVSVKLYPECYF